MMLEEDTVLDAQFTKGKPQGFTVGQSLKW